MEKFSTKTLFALGMVAATLLYSCSRQIASTASVNKMLNNEQLVSAKQGTNNATALCSPAMASLNSCQSLNIPTSDMPVTNTLATLKPKNTTRKSVVSLPLAIVHRVQTQTATLTSMVKNPDIASYNSEQHTEGLLGIAGIFLIVAIALAVFGVTNMGVVFWEIAAVLFIAAIVFFILYLVAKAAGPSTP